MSSDTNPTPAQILTDPHGAAIAADDFDFRAAIQGMVEMITANISPTAVQAALVYWSRAIDSEHVDIAKQEAIPLLKLFARDKSLFESVPRDLTHRLLNMSGEDEVYPRPERLLSTGIQKKRNQVADALDSYKLVNKNSTIYDPDDPTRELAATSRYATAKTLAVLAQDNVAAVRRKVAANPNTSVATMETLGADTDKQVRGAVARNPRVSTGIVDRLAEDPTETVRANAASNPQISVLKLMGMLEDRSLVVVQAAVKNPSLPDYLKSIVKLARD